MGRRLSEHEWVSTVYQHGAQAVPEDQRPGEPMIEGIDWRTYIETQRAGGDVTQLPGYVKERFEKDEAKAIGASVEPVGETSEGTFGDPLLEGIGGLSTNYVSNITYSTQRRKPAHISSPVAANIAINESIITGDGNVQQRSDTYKNSTTYDSVVADFALDILQREGQREKIEEILRNPDLSSPEKLLQMQSAMVAVKWDSLAPIELLSLHAFAMGNHTLPMPTLRDTYYTDISMTELNAIRSMWTERSFKGAGRVINDYVASLGTDFDQMNALEIFTMVGFQDFTPIVNVLTRAGLGNEVLQEISGKKSDAGDFLFMSGEIRQKIREYIYSNRNDPEALEEIANAFVQTVDSMRKDPEYGWAITTYNVVELFEAVWTDGLLKGQTPTNSLDRTIGNVETGLEALFSVILLGKVAKAGSKGLRSLFTSKAAVQAIQQARLVGNHKAAAMLEQKLAGGELSHEIPLLPVEGAADYLPRPAMLADDLKDTPDGIKAVAFNLERQRQTLLLDSNNLTALSHTVEDKVSVISDTINKIDLADAEYVHPRMSWIQMHQDETGFDLVATVGKTAEGGWDSLDDAVEALIRLDNTGENSQLMRINAYGVLEPVFESPNQILSYLKREIIPSKAVSGGPADIYYIQLKQSRAFHQADKLFFGENAFIGGAGFLRGMLAPFSRFGKDIYNKFAKAYMQEQKITADFNEMLSDYYKLGNADKQYVTRVMDWTETFGKDHGRNPSMMEIYGNFGDITEAQVKGVMSLRYTYETMYDLFNRRLYREFNARGLQTARSADPSAARYHGAVLPRDEAGKKLTVLNPNTHELEVLDKNALDMLYAQGGGVMKLDIAVDVAGNKGSANLVMIGDDVGYRAGKLSDTPLEYYPGYQMRFYDDPYYILKTTEEVLNGVPTGRLVTQAIKTSGTAAEGNAFIGRLGKEGKKTLVDSSGNTVPAYEVKPAISLSTEEGNLYQKEVLHREGRLFWDKRANTRLPDVNGNAAQLQDPVMAIQRGVILAARASTSEDLMAGMKLAFNNEFSDILSGKLKVQSKVGDYSAFIKRLKEERRQVLDPARKARFDRAIETVQYFKMMDGATSAVVPALREAALGLATMVGRMQKFQGKTRGLEKWAMQVDPFRAMRSAAFNAFLVFRPVRQVLMQSAQIGYLAGLMPGYVFSRQLFKDAFGLRRGLAQVRISGFQDGFSFKEAARQMGMSEVEYKRLIREFHRSGLVDTVDVHSFSGGARKAQIAPIRETKAGVVGMAPVQAGKEIKNFAQKWGFDFGERNNLTFTYGLALRRMMKENGYTSVMQISRAEWDDLAVEASNLGLAMIKPNNFMYQHGALGVATQFLSFSHKAALGFLGKNPALKGMDSLRILGMSYLLYGANIFGARNQIEELFREAGVQDMEIPGLNGETVIDLLTGGLIETTTNKIMTFSSEEARDLDLEFIAPGVNVGKLYEAQLMGILTKPMSAIFGPFGSMTSRMLRGYNIAAAAAEGNPDAPASDKFQLGANLVLSGALPIYNDVWRSYLAYKLGNWYSMAGEPLPLEPTMQTMIARGLLGVRSQEENSFYDLQKALRDNKEARSGVVKGYREAFNNWNLQVNDGLMTPQAMENSVRMMMELLPDDEEFRASFVFEMFINPEAEGQPALIENMVNEGIGANLSEAELQMYFSRMDMDDNMRQLINRTVKEIYTDHREGGKAVVEHLEEEYK